MGRTGGDVEHNLLQISDASFSDVITVYCKRWRDDVVRVAGSKPITWKGFGGGSGGGFSWQFDMPSYQQASTSMYLNRTDGLPPHHSFNANGRAYPDISGLLFQALLNLRR